MDGTREIVVRIMHIRGSVQGVGFRPHVYRTAQQFQIQGWVRNNGSGVFICAAGPEADVTAFLHAVTQHPPPAAMLSGIHIEESDETPPPGFHILNSADEDRPTAAISPDLATCPDCLRELFDPSNRRYHYPFINCTQCGPRYSIVERIPYDRPHTTMRTFTLCPACQAEYDDPLDRRFHAQPNACPVCGPRLFWKAQDAAETATGSSAIDQAIAAIQAGRIVAVKGIGGFHLMTSAWNNETIQRLRERKARDEKPFAMLFPSLDILKAWCEIDPLEESLLTSSAAPIVLLKRKPSVPNAMAPDNPLLGCMLPYAPLHHLLMHALDEPVIATSGNRSDEPICIDNEEAMNRLETIADAFLFHDRPIARPVDDSVVRVMAGRPMILRRARGYAPTPVSIPHNRPEPILAVGGHLKNTICLAQGNQAIMSQHVGDLETLPADQAFENAVTTLSGLYASKPVRIVCDLHPDYRSTQYARRQPAAVTPVQHHYAHVLSVMADNHLTGDVLGVAWDGTGLGTDVTIWGGEFLLANEYTFTRAAYFRHVPLPGGDRAIQEPARVAMGLLYELFGKAAFDMTDLPPFQVMEPETQHSIRHMLENKIRSPITSSAGRLFDAVASLLNLKHRSGYEGQAAMLVEFAADEDGDGVAAHIDCPCDGSVIDWAPLFERLIEGVRQQDATSLLARIFHESLAHVVRDVAHRAGMERVVLSGGCFQNKRLLERTIDLLREGGYSPYWHDQVPCNDGGLSLGQAYWMGSNACLEKMQNET